MGFTLPRINSSLLLLCVALAPSSASAGAVLFIYPTLVLFDGAERSATVTLTNRGDAIGTFETSWAEMAMTPEGNLIKVEGEVPWSLQPYVRHSPRRVTLAPAESQIIRIALRRGQDVPEGEYFSHFKVLTLNTESVVEQPKEAAQPQETESAVTITARPAVAIPVLWRNSSAKPRATIESVVVDAENNSIDVQIRRLGDLSVRGYLHVMGDPPYGMRGPLAPPVPLIIYPMVSQRSATIPLSEGITTDMLARNTTIVYADDMDRVDETTVLAARPLRD